ncbi:MAG: autotransporter outer membrane beta-barrel domain-containing protein [Methylococcales bacterium]
MNSFLTRIFCGLFLFAGFAPLAIGGGQMLVTTADSGNTVILDFIADPNDLSFFDTLVTPAGCNLTTKPGSNIKTCEVPSTPNNQYVASYTDANGATQTIGGVVSAEPTIDVALGSPIDAVLQAFATECSSATISAELKKRCDELPDNKLEAANALVPVQLTAQTGQVVKIGRGQMQNIRQRMDGLHRGTKKALSVNFNGQTLPINGGGAGDDVETLLDGRLGVFINGRFQASNKAQKAFEAGFDSETFAATAGLDYRLLDDLVVGVAIGYDNTNTNLHAYRGKQEINAITGLVYGTYNLPSEMYVNLGAAYGGLDYDADRHITYLQNNGRYFNGTTHSTPQADQFSLTTGFGKDFALDAWRLTPNTRLDYTEVNIDANNEQGNTGFESHNSAQTAQSLATTAGFKVAYAYSIPWGVLSPELNLEWQHEFLNKATRMNGTLGNSQIFTNSNGPDRDYFNVGGTLVGTFSEGRSAFLSYETRLGQSTISSHIVQIGLRIPF